MNTNRLSTQQLLGIKVQYRMPLFQRPQSWGQRDRNILWQDLMSVYQKWIDPNHASNRIPHFLGATVIQQVTAQPGDSTYLVIDGQQRLTNLWVILAVIRDQARDELNDWGTLNEEIQGLYITNQFVTGSKRQKLLLGALDQADLEQISNSEIPDHHSTLGKVYGDYRRKLKQANKDCGGLDLDTLKDCVVDGINVVSIVMEPSENPYQIFESLNAKGRRLTNADLVRNYILMQIDEKEQEDLYKSYWLPMEQEVVKNDKENDDSLTEFFARFLTSTSGIRVIEKHVYDTMKTRDGTNKGNGITTQSLVQDLHEHHRYFCQMRRILDHADAEVNKQLQYLADWKIDLADPLIMKVLQLEQDGRIPASELVEALAKLEGLIVRRFICQMPPRELGDPLARMAHEAPETDLTTWFKEQISTASLYPSDERFSEDFATYRSSKSKPESTEGGR